MCTELKEYTMAYFESEKFPLGTTIPDLKGYSIATAMSIAISFSKKTEEEIAEEMGWSASVKNRILSNQDYWPSLSCLPKFCDVVGNEVIPRWIIDNSACLSAQSTPMNAQTLFKALRQMMKEVAELLAKGEAALEGEKVLSKEAKKVIQSLEEIFHLGCRMLSGLKAVVEKEKEKL